MIDAAPSSVQRTLEAAREVSLVDATASGQWELGWELYRIAAIAQSKRPFQAAAEVLENLSRETGETAVLTVLDPHRHARMYVAAGSSQHAVRFVPQLFTWMPGYAGASGRAILAFRPDAERTAVYEAAGAFPGHAAPDVKKIERALAAVRKQGYAVTRDDANLGASAASAPITTGTSVTCSVAVVAPNQRFEAMDQDRLVQQVLEAAASIGGRIGDPLSSLQVVS
jgi:DNA-binding IclR family transcriptional regulator